MTSRRRTLAALALEDTKGLLEDGVKLVTGERRSLEASEAGSWPRVEVLKHSDTRSFDLLPLVIPVQISRDSRRLNTNKVACDPIDNRLEHGDVWIPGDRRGSLRVSVTIPISLYLAMTLFRILPPRLEITMAASTGLQPCLRISLV